MKIYYFHSQSEGRINSFATQQDLLKLSPYETRSYFKELNKYEQVQILKKFGKSIDYGYYCSTNIQTQLYEFNAIFVLIIVPGQEYLIRNPNFPWGDYDLYQIIF